MSTPSLPRSVWFALGAIVLMLASLGRADAPAGRYTNVTGGVKDNMTKLVWQQPISMSMVTASQANSYCATLGTGWRAPSMNELSTLVDRGLTNPSIDGQYFPGTPVNRFWTSTPAENNASASWFVDFTFGAGGDTDASTPYLVRCVRWEP